MTTILKLTNGVEVVGNVEVETDSEVVLHKPLQINYRYVFGSIPSVSFARYIMFAEHQSVYFQKQHILQQVNVREAFANYYLDIVDEHYDDLEKRVDAEFESSLANPTQEQYMKELLEMMPVDEATVN